MLKKTAPFCGGLQFSELIIYQLPTASLFIEEGGNNVFLTISIKDHVWMVTVRPFCNCDKCHTLKLENF